MTIAATKNFVILWACSTAVHGLAQSYASVATVAGTGAGGLTNGPFASSQFHAPYDIVEGEPNGTFYLADALNHCVRKMSNGSVTILAGNGSQGDVDGQGLNARFYAPTGVSYSNGFVYVTDNGNNKIKRIDSLGNVMTIAGSGAVGCADGAALLAEFNNPVGILVDQTGIIYIADYGNAAIRRLDTGYVSTFAGGCGSPGDAIGPLSSARFNNPSDIAIGPFGEFYIVDQSNNKLKVIPSGGQVELLAGSGLPASVDGTGAGASLAGPAFADIGPGGNLLVSDWIGNKIRHVTPAGVVTTVAGSGAQGSLDGPVLTATFDVPYGICVATSGEVLISDKANNRIRRLIPHNFPDAIEVSLLNAGSFAINVDHENGQLIISNAEQGAEFVIIDPGGRVVISTTMIGWLHSSQTTFTIPIAFLSPGAYFVALTSKGARHVLRFVH